MPHKTNWQEKLDLKPQSIGDLADSSSNKLFVRLNVSNDVRGNIAISDEDDLPFSIKRIFFVYGSAMASMRGNHAHKLCKQLLIATSGWTDVFIEGPDRSHFSVKLDQPSYGLLIPPRYWACQYKRSNEAVLTVLASRRYEPNDYIRSYDDWEKLIELNTS